MSLPGEPGLQQLQFYATAAYPCSYLQGQQAQSLIAVPHHLIDASAYTTLIQQGFRRSGKFTYRPHCADCQACVPVRLPVEHFQPGRSQRRVWKRYGHLSAHVMELQFHQSHFDLYRSYQQARHPAGDMTSDDAGQYRNFLLQSHVDTVLVEFREGDELRMVSVVDCLANGLSAVYAFYDCRNSAASYGTYNILWLAKWCRQRGQPHLYLGYWIADSRKMAYKRNFRPLEAWSGNAWQPLP